MLFATACSQDQITGEIGSNSTVTFTVELPKEVSSSRSFGNGTTATKLSYAVYQDGALLENLTSDNNVDITNGVANVQLDLIKGKTYTIAFWADAPESIYTFDAVAKTITANYNGATANNESYDAFYKAETITVDGTGKSVTLTRPFAQINFGTDTESAINAGLTNINELYTEVVIKDAFSQFNLLTGEVIETSKTDITFAKAQIPSGEEFPIADYRYLAMNYVMVHQDYMPYDVTLNVYENSTVTEPLRSTPLTAVPMERNYKTNVYGKLLTTSTDITINIIPAFVQDDKNTAIVVNNTNEFVDAFGKQDVHYIILGSDINLNDVASRSVADPTYTIASGKKLTIDLNDKILSATSTQIGKNYNMLNVKGTLTVKNGRIEYEHLGDNMGWNSSTNIFDVTAGGILNLENVTAKNLGGSDMGFVAHLNNWGEVTLNVEDCTLESNYVAVRVFNSGNDMNNVTIKNSTLKGGSYAFWVHNYTVADFGSEAKAESQKALLNINIYNQGNTFSPDINGIRYGFTNSVKTDARGITKTVSEDGTIVTLGSVVENGLIRRGVAGTEENTTITKVVVGEGVTTLYDRTFRRFYALETVELPSTLTTIGATGSGVFQSCTNLKNIVIPESVTVIGKGTFQECSSLESINIPAGVTRIESDALRATGLKSVEFHAGVTYFGAQAFRDCKQLTEVIIDAPEFTMEDNTFGIMAAPFTPMTIYVANAEMKAYVESKLTAHAKTYITVVAPELIGNTADLQVALEEGKNVTLANDLTIADTEMITAPYGNKTALSHNGGVFNGNGKTISVTIGGDNYAVMTNGGTIKNLTIDNGFRGIMVMSPTQTVYLENVVSSGEGVCYALNTGEGDSTQDIVATNCTFNGWSSWSEIKSATFTNCTFGQGAYYTNVYGRLGKPYVTTLFDGCEFGSKFYIDLSALKADQVVTLKNCTVNGVKLTAENWTSLVAPEDTCGEGQISIELKNGTYMTANNVADYVIFE